jgi:hypothetical protein
LQHQPYFTAVPVVAGRHALLPALLLRRLPQAEAAEVKLKEESAAKLALQKEVLQLKLISAESEQANQSLREQLAEVSKALVREQAEHQATSAAVTDLRTSLVSREQQLAEARQLLDSMSAELGVLSSRYHRLQQERDALRFARRQQQQQQQAISQPPSSLEPLTGAAAAAAQLQQRLLSGGSISIAPDVDADSSSSSGLWLAQASRAAAGLERSNSQPSADLHRSQEQHQRVRQLTSSPAAAAAAASESSSSRSQSAAGSSRDGSLPVELPAAAGLVQGLHHLDAAAHDEPVRLCEHGQLEAACLLCICQRFLAATAGSCSHLGAASGARAGLLSTSGSAGALPAPASPGGSGSNAVPSAAGLATVAMAACASEAVQYRQFLSISELARNRLEAENATLQQQATDLQRQVDQQQQQLRVLQANPAALSACTIQELTALEGEQQAGLQITALCFAMVGCLLVRTCKHVEMLALRHWPVVPRSNSLLTSPGLITVLPPFHRCCCTCQAALHFGFYPYMLYAAFAATCPPAAAAAACRHARDQHQGGAPGGAAAQHSRVPGASQRGEPALRSVHGGPTAARVPVWPPDLPQLRRQDHILPLLSPRHHSQDTAV